MRRVVRLRKVSSLSHAMLSCNSSMFVCAPRSVSTFISHLQGRDLARSIQQCISSDGKGGLLACMVWHNDNMQRNKRGRPNSTRIRTEMDDHEKMVRKCGICRVVRHNKNTYPNRGATSTN